MSEKKSKENGSDASASAREDRLRAALRANLTRRKAQKRARAVGPGSEGPEGPEGHVNTDTTDDTGKNRQKPS